jgi:hypothetical protein
MTMTATYAIDTGDGIQITTGLSAHTAHRTAQRIADERGEPVYLYETGTGEDELEAEEIAPTEIEVQFDAASGPRVIYGAQDAETVEAEIPAGWSVDWSNAVDLAPSGTHRIRYSAPLVVTGPEIYTREGV